MKMIPNKAVFAARQKGMTLVVVLVVLLVLTLLGLAATDSGNLQKAMVRNNQFRLEAFNTSASEIAAQIDHYNQFAGVEVDEDDKVNPIFAAIDMGRLSSEAADDANTKLPFQTKNDLFEKTVDLLYVKGCPVKEYTIGSLKCNLLRIDSDSKYTDTNIGSDQAQTFGYNTFN